MVNVRFELTTNSPWSVDDAICWGIRPSLMEQLWEPKTNVFGPQNQSSILWTRNWWFFRLNFSVFIFGTASNRKWGPIFDQRPRSKLVFGFGFPHIVGGNKSWDMPKTALVPRPRLSAKQATRPVLLAVPWCPPRHASGITTSRWDVLVVIVSTMRAAAMLRNHIFFCLVEDEKGSRRLGDSCWWTSSTQLAGGKDDT